ncbi:non-structural maintenance of chromosomes element 3 homolog isoform X1 [Schistocerca cancellata]|uniref:non-structural maintenance of chromosomes element 3 homolog isoform X1 n=1 Tax=Schistocerca cancellata TaxID=274614 RepID=UPI002118F47C|nr:non-structural maintenance of chromosomes element 3 homolog isoform X1 [Schistocerca cancellata]
MSQRNLSQDASEERLDALASETLRYLLGLAHTKLPVKRQDITKNVLKDYSKNFKAVMERTKRFLNEDYGIDVAEVGTSAGNKSYILINQFRYKDIPSSSRFVSDSMKSQQILLMIVLSFVFMKGGVVKEDVLWEFLIRLGLIKKGSNAIHERFGDVNKFVSQDFIRQLYLEYRIVPNTDPPKHEFALGKRAELEVSYRGLLEFMSSVYGNSNIQVWNTQYEAVMQQEHMWMQRNRGGNELFTCSQSSTPSDTSPPLSQTATNSSLRSRQYSLSQPGPSGLQSRGAGSSSSSQPSGTFLHPSSLSQTRQRSRSNTSSQGPVKKLRS